MKSFSRNTVAGVKECAVEAAERPDGFDVPARGATLLPTQDWPGEVTQEEKASLAGSR